MRQVSSSSQALEELAVWVSFVPFMSVDLRAKYDRRVCATDASSRSCAAVFTQMPEDLVREIWRHRPRRGIGQAYDDAAVAAEEAEVERGRCAAQAQVPGTDSARTRRPAQHVCWALCRVR